MYELTRGSREPLFLIEAHHCVCMHVCVVPLTSCIVMQEGKHGKAEAKEGLDFSRLQEEHTKVCNFLPKFSSLQTLFMQHADCHVS